jgi:hypothetical protein
MKSAGSVLLYAVAFAGQNALAADADSDKRLAQQHCSPCHIRGDDLEREISKCDAMIERQQAVVAGIEANGGDGALARTLLEAVSAGYAGNTAARKHECMFAIRVENGRLAVLLTVQSRLVAT